MNKRQKEKSREIRDIMRTDKWGRMTYQEAKRKWRKGVRALPMAKLAHCAAERGLTVDYTYEPALDYHLLRFVGRDIFGHRYGYSITLMGYELRMHRCSIHNLVDRIIADLDYGLAKLGKEKTSKVMEGFDA